MPPTLEDLKGRLLRGGVAQRHSKRYIAELHDHFYDLFAEARAAGTSPDRAASEALSRLGGVDVLAAAMVGRPELQSLSARSPALAYLIVPTSALVLGVLFTLAALVALCGAGRSSTWLVAVASVLVPGVNRCLPLVLGWATLWGACQRGAKPIWPASSLVLLAVASVTGQVAVTLPAVGAPGEIDFLPSLGPDHVAATIAQVALDLCLMLAPIAALKMWRARSALPGSEGDRP